MKTVGLALVLLLGGMACAPGRARADGADDDARARLLYEEGRRSFDVRRFDEALARFRAAYQLTPQPALLYNIALAEDRSGDPRAALASITTFLRRAEPGPATHEAEVYRVELELRVAALDRPAPRRPLYKRWWLWTTVGVGVAAIALGVGLGVGLSRDPFSTTLPGVDLRPGAAH